MMLDKYTNFTFYFMLTTTITIMFYQRSFSAQDVQAQELVVALHKAKEVHDLEPALNSTYTSMLKKNWTVIVYMAADNDLRSFAARNIKQMAAVGSNALINIIVHLDIRIAGNKKITRRYYIEKNKIFHVNANDASSQKMDSGDPQTLISCCAWGIQQYPADHYALIFWNHGTGPLDPVTGRILNPTELFTFNPTINKFELDRSIGFLDLIDALNGTDETTNIPLLSGQEFCGARGVCWDDSTGNYLTNQKLDAALNVIKDTYLAGKKFSIIAFDACLMATIEIANIIKKYADYMVSSQEVELGTGWHYERVLAPFETKSLSTREFAQHMVTSYGITYAPITNEFTQSALNLAVLDMLETNVSLVAQLLSTLLQKQKNNSVKNAIAISRSKDACTHFDEPSYLDLHHLYSNLQAHINQCLLINEQEGTQLKSTLFKLFEEGKQLIKQLVTANVTGKNLKNAQGISIYFPERKIHYSYKNIPFCQTNHWCSFIAQFLAA